MIAGLQIYLCATAITYQFMQDDLSLLIVNIEHAQHYVEHNSIETITTKDIKEFAEIEVRSVNKQDRLYIVFGITLLVYSVLSYSISYCLS
jgi:hypothetical protein